MLYQLGSTRSASGDRHSRLSRFFLLGAVISIAPLSPAGGAELDAPSRAGSLYHSQQPLTGDELDAFRGRLLIEGWDIALGLNIVSLLNGVQIQQLGMELDDSGQLVTTQFVAADPLPDGVSILINGELVHGPAFSGDQLASLPPNPSGVIVSTSDGFSAILHVVGDSHLGNVLVNDAIGRSLSQTLTVDITIANFSSLMPDLQAASLASTLNQAVSLGVINALP